MRWTPLPVLILPRGASSSGSKRRLLFCAQLIFLTRPLSFLHFSVDEVCDLFEDVLGLDQYTPALKNSHVDGATLAWCNDHETLRDMGLKSVGHRLSVLRAVYELKVRDGVRLEEHDYCPPCACDILSVLYLLSDCGHAQDSKLEPAEDHAHNRSSFEYGKFEVISYMRD